MDAPEPQEKNGEQAGIGPMAGAIIIVLLLALAGIYFLLQEQQRLHAPPIQEQLNA